MKSVITLAKRWLLQQLVAEFPQEAARLVSTAWPAEPDAGIPAATRDSGRATAPASAPRETSVTVLPVANAAALVPEGYRPGTDWLTGLPDRHAFMRRLQGLRNMRANGAARVPGVLAVIDLDQFKQVNAVFGHRAGDVVLCRFARALVQLGPPACSVARLGGDEFLLHFQQAQPAEAEAVLQVLARSIDGGIQIGDGTPVMLTFSAGIASFGDVNIEQTLADAEAAMHLAKHSGRNAIMVSDGTLRPSPVGRGALAAAVTELQHKIRELQQESRTDVLTGLHNRRALDEVLDVAPASQHYKWTRTMVAFMDIDYFGDVNKLYGDSEGDLVLALVAVGLRSCLRPDDLLFRKGGEEFVAVLPDERDQDAAAWGERLRRAVEDLAIPHAASLASSVVTITVGVASGSARRTVRELMYAASELTMRAKRNGQRNRVHLEALDP